MVSCPDVNWVGCFPGNYEIPRVERFLYWTWYFTDSGIIGSKEYILRQFQRFRICFRRFMSGSRNGFRGLWGFIL
jgi:hypothetical protein